jgi:hypothetical protein
MEGLAVEASMPMTTLNRKVTKRKISLLLVVAEPLASPMPIDGDGDIAETKKPRLEVPPLVSPTTEDSASSSKIVHAIKKHTKEDWNAVAAMVAGIWAADQGDILQTHTSVISDASAALFAGQMTTSVDENRCHNEVDKSIDQATGLTGKRTSGEGETLMGAVEKHNNKNCDAMVPDRTKTQCTGRWHGALDPSINRKTGRMAKWTADESKTLKDAVEKYNGKNWDAIAELVPGRTKKQCTNRWYHNLVPSVGTGRTDTWTTDDDNKLKYAVEKHGDENWDAIAARLPGRSKIQCWSRWHIAVDPNIDLTAPRTGPWTKDEDDKLKKAAEKYGGKNWDAVAALVPSRTRNQCAGRWHDTLDPSIRRTERTGKWTPDEDKALKHAVEIYNGKNWDAIASLVPGRTRKQCTNRWYNALDPSIATRPTDTWTTNDDNKLQDAVEKYGDENWDAIIPLLPGRTKVQCRSRWQDAVTPRTGRWTADEDNKLKKAIEKCGGKNWVAVATLIPNRTRRQCRDRWCNALDPSVAKAMVRNGKWTTDEDSKLKDAVRKHSAKNWAAIAELVPDRGSKQCWGRWYSVLDPSIDPPTGKSN